MKSIITWAFAAIQNPVPNLDLSSIPAKPRGKLRLSPEQLRDLLIRMSEHWPQYRVFEWQKDVSLSQQWYRASDRTYENA